MENFINPRKHEPVLLVLDTGFEKHISKKCPINGQYLFKYFRNLIQLNSGNLLQREEQKDRHHPVLQL